MFILTPAQDLANQVSREFAFLKRSGVEKIDFSKLVTNVINGNGISDPRSFSYLKSEVSKIFAQKRAEKKQAEKTEKLAKQKKPVAEQKSFYFQAQKIG